jgi:hypothetical protein
MVSVISALGRLTRSLEDSESGFEAKAGFEAIGTTDSISAPGGRGPSGRKGPPISAPTTSKSLQNRPGPSLISLQEKDSAGPCRRQFARGKRRERQGATEKVSCVELNPSLHGGYFSFEDFSLCSRPWQDAKAFPGFCFWKFLAHMSSHCRPGNKVSKNKNEKLEHGGQCYFPVFYFCFTGKHERTPVMKHVSNVVDADSH